MSALAGRVAVVADVDGSRPDVWRWMEDRERGISARHADYR